MKAYTRNNAINTDELIHILAEDIPKKQYRHPAWYFITWLTTSSLLVLAYLSAVFDVRFDLILRLTDGQFVVGVGSMLLGSCIFAYSALLHAIPGRKNTLLPWFGIICMVIWIEPIVLSMLQHSSDYLADKVLIRFDAGNFVHIFIAGCIPLAILWHFVVHKLAPTKPKRIARDVALASFLLSACVVRFFYVHLYQGTDCGYAVFFWILLPFALLSLVASVFFHSLFKLRVPRKYTRERQRVSLRPTVA